jgi:hypothetical protein
VRALAFLASRLFAPLLDKLVVRKQSNVARGQDVVDPKDHFWAVPAVGPVIHSAEVRSVSKSDLDNARRPLALETHIQFHSFRIAARVCRFRFGHGSLSDTFRMLGVDLVSTFSPRYSLLPLFYVQQSKAAAY